MRGILATYYRELLVYKRRALRYSLSSIVNPVLFLLAFGYGLSSLSLFNSNSYLRFMVPGLIAVSSMNQAYSISFDIHIARLYTMTYQGLLVAPIERWEILVGELLFAITKSLSPLIFFVVYLSFFPSLGLVLNIPFFISWLIHVLTWALIGVVIAFKIDSHADHATFTTFVVTPITFISDTFFPVSRLGGFFELIANFSPLTHTTRMIRYSMQSGFGLPFIIELGYSLIVLLIFAIFGIIVLSRAER